ncbi:hypothetical protein GLOIN_2v1766050 [Rhizophagus irregularis DAOM 181602=DAOM 197198]|uniref:Uncharacterized protein n=1 Tax=Rhizophagus irregularis (strain DAOM 181602 / DAOM 197198 / MUCL 43194) TaxID=747089 RepID=A0A2P4QMX4_RHIID|nr:hypothetical protein GLOIN_2v1766050 [Rhizophagus irregularis DAOM 181602=DAOM 197198]POG79011.1 hypothetical protein GLOIN_2v1766050 [Rhizophagus irregularis DAOM 181602=DAOM 197198]|eukprot:XP_025185877.1 hypothetical protein GLOIN_2v1766050 [Rhizophagus irregularis DAOM 181602=DAOM 197198]
MSEVYLGNANGYVECSILSNKGLIKIEKLDEKRIALYWYSSPNITTGEVLIKNAKLFASRVLGFSRSQIPIYEEHSYYLDEIKTPQALPEVDPFE